MQLTRLSDIDAIGPNSECVETHRGLFPTLDFFETSRTFVTMTTSWLKTEPPFLQGRPASPVHCFQIGAAGLGYKRYQWALVRSGDMMVQLQHFVKMRHPNTSLSSSTRVYDVVTPSATADDHIPS